MKTILITGVSRGIGHTLAHYLLEKGYRVIGVGRNFPEDLRVSQFRFFPCDLLDLVQVESLVSQLENEAIDVFVHNAMYTPKHAPFIRYRADDFLKAHFISTVAPTLIIQKIAMNMKKQAFGRILFIGSLIQHTGTQGQLPYLTAKSALSGLVKGLALELGKYSVTTNLFLLGAVETAKLKENLGAERLERLKEKLTYQRFIQEIDIAKSLESFINNSQTLINGTEIILSDTQHLRGI